MPELIDGKIISAAINEETARRCAEIKNKTGLVPGLAVVQVGDRPDSTLYVRKKVETCQALGIHSEMIRLDAATSESELLQVIDSLNARSDIHGILVQSPPPDHINEETIVAAIDPLKDVDGFHPVNVGKMTIGDPTALVACTPAGCVELLKRSGVELSGKRAVVLGRSMIVGKPLALLLLAQNCTVTVCHSKTRDLPAITRQAEILCVAIGKPEFVTADFVSPGTVVIDVGIHVVADSSRKSGKRTTGDVKFDQVSPLASKITPVPGGVGPMTIALLMQNTIKAFELQNPA
ncbi:bifunctional methylenetetrahydrofolate dehydrogenase/methenyltetrahydrofolate cyclohydrolase FolD [Oscillatoria amoena NRMC-F 0135]|nr:bifunctional methylenetetrahydrofolate dehydrogenase/methenyltetrahydrofolate cyclohydrolase FolD [Oscillatoria laete-virens]MDL5048409.1 bifunctional methylenetetrahydrofolate dehydrogenase/methenyltetrahydrofolate cyclohydrolase FolD [Oscillatoria amoena NRMC-F 0135]MDL5055680.1 bifunctional methylenetetrahydrofolate dehydrogenase/methenyltetrahydrofolate cyclohydrolase FolD [Oscillatoria laete-virens NRMC-F 0139]